MFYGSYRTYSSLVKLQPWFVCLWWKTYLEVELQPWCLSMLRAEHYDDDDDDDDDEVDYDDDSTQETFCCGVHMLTNERYNMNFPMCSMRDF